VVHQVRQKLGKRGGNHLRREGVNSLIVIEVRCIDNNQRVKEAKTTK